MPVTTGVKSSPGGERVLIRELLERDPYRPISSVIRVTDADPHRVWAEMEEYVPASKITALFRDVVDVLLETRQGASEQLCIWVSGFFGSGKSHFLKALGYLLQDRTLYDPEGREISSAELLSVKLGLSNQRQIIVKELCPRVLFLNLLDHDPQAPDRPTIGRLIYRTLLQEEGLSTEFWVAAWERELQEIGKWDSFRDWVQDRFGRAWEQERKLNAELVLQQALPHFRPELYRSEEDAARAIAGSKSAQSEVQPSDVIAALRAAAERLDPQKGRMVVLLDEVGLYIGDSIPRLTELNALAEQVVQKGGGKVLLIATAQEALTDLVGRLSADPQTLEWLKDRFRLRFGLEATEVPEVLAKRFLAKRPEAAKELDALYNKHQGTLRTNLTLGSGWGKDEWRQQYPLPPYMVSLVQDIMAGLRGSVEEARRLSGSSRSMLKLAQAVLTGEGGILAGSEQPLGWLASLDLFYDALKADLQTVRSEQAKAIDDLEKLGEVQGLPLARIGKALFLLQQVHKRIPCTPENIAAALVDRVDMDIHSLRQAVREGLARLQQEGWVAAADSQYRLLTPEEMSLERLVLQNYPKPAELQKGAAELLRDMLRSFRFEHGQIRRPLKVRIEFGAGVEPLSPEGALVVRLFSPFAEESDEEVEGLSIAEPETLLWQAAADGELKGGLERAIAVRKTLGQLNSASLKPAQAAYRAHLEQENQTAWQVTLRQLMENAFLRGRLLLEGKALPLQGNDLEGVLRAHLHQLVGKVYHEFVDERPDRDEDVAAILRWQPGGALPAVYARAGLVTKDNQIRHEAGLLAKVKEELRRRESYAQGCCGADLLAHFEGKPYGWDPRLLRLLAATLFKAGLVKLQVGGSTVDNPADPRAATTFLKDQDFKKALLSYQEEVDWREAAQWCSKLFGAPAANTFQGTAQTVREQAMKWADRAEELATRCRDNSVPSALATACAEVQRTLSQVADPADPAALLRRFLDCVKGLSDGMAVVRRLDGFDFDAFRAMREWAKEASDWGEVQSGQTSERWQRFHAALSAPDVLDRWTQMAEDYNYLRHRFRDGYWKLHAQFQEAVTKALEEVRTHRAFELKPQEANARLASFSELLCAGPPEGQAAGAPCPACRRRFALLSDWYVQQKRTELRQQLDALLPIHIRDEQKKRLEPMELHETVHSEAELRQIYEKMERYRQQAGGEPIEVQATVRPAKEA